MKRLYIIGIMLLMIITPALAADWIIEDTFIGGGYYIDQYNQDYPGKAEQYYKNNGDVISETKNLDKFNVERMDVNIDNNGNVTVSIATLYTDGLATTHYGDLFISTDGWTPYGDAPYMKDIIGTGETWEYVFDTNAFVSGTDERPIYSTATGTFITSDDVHGGGSNKPYHFRHDQEVQFAAAAPDDFSGAGYFYNEVEGFLTYAFNLDDLGLSADEAQDLGFRWTMTCANDIIEGGVHWEPVPEPGTMILLGMGLIGLGAVGRKKISNLT